MFFPLFLRLLSLDVGEEKNREEVTYQVRMKDMMEKKKIEGLYDSCFV